jgi:aquaporin Z
MEARKYLAELVGTFILVVVGSLTIVAAGMMQTPIQVVEPFGFGLGLLAAIQSAGYVSGGHFNPAVTVGALLDRRIDVVNALGYIVAQVIGAIAASAVVLLLASQEAVKSTASGFPPDRGVQAFAVEVLLTGVFLLVILTVTKRAPNHAAFAIPLSVTVIHVAGIPVRGASVNAARYVPAALVGGSLDQTIVVWIAGPVLGAILGWAVYRALEDGSTR